MNYQTKSKKVKVIQWKGDNLSEVIEFIDKVLGYTGRFDGKRGKQIFLKVPTGSKILNPGDWIVRQPGTNFVMTNDEFQRRYEKS